ncbi:LPD1 domain-containing protein [Psychrobacter sp.]|uniref:LPD1 domain-containing protein n=1 Tax=Psychrobacter sp. TaxID=56811 RepID=UPI0025D875BD|nr:LPD1 domain-containing protein [Psychrobacter sp.]
MNETIQLINNLDSLRLSLTNFSDRANQVQRQAVIDSLKALGVDYKDDSNDAYSDNRNDENYRYADTGYIAGSKKELASNRIKQLAKDGVAVKVKDIDWDEIEADSLMAESLINKSNIMGDFDYSELKNNGVQPDTAFLIQKVLASVAKEPFWDLVAFAKTAKSGYSIRNNHNMFLNFVRMMDELGPAKQKQMMRKAYVAGIDTLKGRIGKCVTPRDLYHELKEIGSELRGSMIGTQTQKIYQEVNDEQSDLFKEIEAESEALYQEALPDLEKIAEAEGRPLKPFVLKSYFPDWLREHYPDRNFEVKSFTGAGMVDADKMQHWYKLNAQLRDIAVIGGFEALTTDETVQQWVALGERFWAIIEMKSDSFVKHINAANSGKYSDWSLTIKDDKAPKDDKPKPKPKPTFELLVTDNYERKGGRDVAVNSTIELKDMFGFRDIQSGNWVLDDKSSAEFHVKNTAAAMMDMSDIVGIDPKSLAFGGRLALAIGARGRKGALAHYEPVQRVINLTKMKGGGTLGHEWFHAIDNILGEVLGNERAIGAGVFLSETPELAGNKELVGAFQLLNDAMSLGTVRAPETFKITQKDIDLARLNIKPDSYGTVQKVILNNDVETAVLEIDKIYGRGANKRSKNHNAWRKVAVAYHNQDKVDQEVTLNVGELVSQYKREALKLDAGRAKNYWSSTKEMAARAFQGYLEDRLEEQGRRNDYLSFGASNSLYDNGYKAYPEGEERALINAAFDNLFKVIKQQKIFENASNDQAMMDSIFGPEAMQSLDHLIVWY